jgi:2-polyprenyl-3-methyl-5-hydroxy-6-metoxy-1,4-benzoquinol methylase
MVDAAYTDQDHQFRENDDYARAKYDITLRWLGPAGSPPRRLLNIGCGAGLFNEMAADAGFVVEACEPDPAAHAFAAENASGAVTVHLGGVFDAPLTAGADVIVMHDVLEHIEDEAATVEALRRLVAPGGRLVISVPAMSSLFGLHDELLGHHRRYNKRSLRSAIEGSFRVERIRYFGMSLIPVTMWFSRWRRKPYPTDAATGPSLLGRAFAAVCAVEARVPLPLGTSLICEAIPVGGSSAHDKIQNQQEGAS